MIVGSAKSRGFAAAVARHDDATPGRQYAGVTISIDRGGGDEHIELSLRHADGTTLTARLSDAMPDRLLTITAYQLGTPSGAPAGATIQ